MYSLVFPTLSLVFWCFSMFFLDSPCFPVFFYVFPSFPMFFSDSPCFSVFFYVFPGFLCFPMFFLDSPCFSVFFYVFLFFPLIFRVFQCFSTFSPVFLCFSMFFRFSTFPPSVFKRHLSHCQKLCADQFKAKTSPPQGKPWAFDPHSCPRRGEFDTKGIPKGRVFELKVRRQIYNFFVSSVWMRT